MVSTSSIDARCLGSAGEHTLRTNADSIILPLIVHPLRSLDIGFRTFWERGSAFAALIVRSRLSFVVSEASRLGTASCVDDAFAMTAFFRMAVNAKRNQIGDRMVDSNRHWHDMVNLQISCGQAPSAAMPVTAKSVLSSQAPIPRPSLAGFRVMHRRFGKCITFGSKQRTTVIVRLLLPLTIEIQQDSCNSNT